MDGNEPHKRSWKTLTAYALLALGCVVFTLRGPVRALDPNGNYDFVLVYSAARAWVHGENPYDKEAVSRAWLNSGGPAIRDPMIGRGPATLVYPPPAFVVLSPVAALPWPIASPLWVVINAFLSVGSLVMLARAIQLTRVAMAALIGLGLCMAPLMTNMAQGQTAVVVLACVCGAALARTRGKSITSGVLLGIGSALKPQLGLLFAVYEAGRLRWKSAAIAGAAIALLTLIGAGRMQAAGIDWWPAWRGNLAAFTTVDDASPVKGAKLRYQIINLHYPLHNFSDSQPAVRFVVYGLVGGLCAIYFVVDLKRRREQGEPPGGLISLGFISAVTLMVAYHRYYDAAILLIPLSLAIRGLALGQRLHAITLALVLLFALPLPIMATEAVRTGKLPEAFTQSWLGQNLILPCQAWGLLVLAAWLIWMRWKEPITQRST